LIAGLGTYPAYYDRLAEINRRGPALLTGAPPLAALDAEQVKTVLADGGFVVDVRAAADYAAGHIPRSLSIPLRDQFATWLGWLVPADTPIAFVTGEDQDLTELVWQPYKIGYERLAGYLDGGMPAWRKAGLTEAGTAFATADQAPTAPYLDVRQAAEYSGGHVRGALNVELGELADHADDVPAGAVVACGHGERAMTAASILERAGHRDLTVLAGSPDDYAAAHGQPLVTKR
jgi:hydroxyacylglutathione hydrolase